MSLALLMNTTCDIVTEVETKSATGMNATTSYTPKASGVPCRVADLTPEQAQAIYGKFDATTQKRVYFVTDQSLTVKDFIVWGGRKFQVHSVQNAGGNLNRLWMVDCVRKPA